MTHDELPEGYEPTNTIEVISGSGRKYEQTRSMTHYELPYVAMIEDLNKLIRKQMKAIDSVPGLHKDEIGWCLICSYPYPCKTIQAIEKELQ